MFNQEHIRIFFTPSVGSIERLMSSALLVFMRVSSAGCFLPFFSSVAIASRIKLVLAIAVTALVAPVADIMPGSNPSLMVDTIASELCVGILYGLILSTVFEALEFAGMLIGMQFSFSLVNLLDPNTMIETPIFSQLFNWLGIIILLSAGLDRILLASLMHTFVVVPLGGNRLRPEIGPGLTVLAGGIFASGLQLATPIMAAALSVEVTISLIGRISPQLPSMILGIPIKTAVSYVVLVGSLALWPVWVEDHFVHMLRIAEMLVARNE